MWQNYPKERHYSAEKLITGTSELESEGGQIHPSNLTVQGVRAAWSHLPQEVVTPQRGEKICL